MKIAIGTPVHGYCKNEFVASLVTLVQTTVKERNDVELQWLSIHGPSVQKARTEIVNAARSVGAEHLLFIDADQEFHPRSLLRLLGHDKAIVAGNYPRKVAPYTPICIGKDGLPLMPAQGLIEAALIGLGIALIRMEVFDAIEAKARSEERNPFPIFDMRATPDGTWLSEDYFFSHLAADAGFELYVDGEMRVGHVGDRTFTFDDTVTSRARTAVADWKAGQPPTT